MPHALILSLALAAAGAAPTAGENLWLVAPLYPGQELLVSRTEAAIQKLLPAGSTDLVGEAALVKLLQTKKTDIGCAVGDRACRNPVDDYLHSLDLAKIVLIKGGQEEPNYTFQVVSTDLLTGETRTASGTGPLLEKALLAALVKVAPLASSLSVISDPPGADLTIDGEKVGQTPFDGQILPGDRVLKLSLAGYQEVQKTVPVGARGEVKVNEKLSLAPSKLNIQVTPKDATVYLDHESKGDGDQTLQVTPGEHLVEVKRTDYEDFSQKVLVEANKTRIITAELHQSVESDILSRSSYLTVTYNEAEIRPSSGVYRTNAFAIDNLTNGGNPNIIAATPSGSQTSMRGADIAYGLQWSYFGLEAIGLGVRANSGGPFNVYPGPSSNNPGNPPFYTFNPGTLVEPGANFLVFDLHGLQPQAQYVWWHFMFQAQAGIGLRTLWIQTPTFQDVGFTHSKGFLNFTPYADVVGTVRFYISKGFYLSASIRDEFMILGTFPEWSFNGGVGYAFH